MILLISERLAILSVLPEKGDFVTLKVLNKLRMSLALTEEEIKNWNVSQDTETMMVSWGENGEAEIPIGEVATGIIVDALRDLDKRKELLPQHYDVYEKFISTTE